MRDRCCTSPPSTRSIAPARRCHPAGELQTGQVLLRLTRTGAVPSPQLDRTTLREALVALPTAETVYNLRVATYQNYFADGVLVHNKSPIIPPAASPCRIVSTGGAHGHCRSDGPVYPRL